MRLGTENRPNTLLQIRLWYATRIFGLWVNCHTTKWILDLEFFCRISATALLSMGALTSVQRSRLEALADDERTAELKSGFCNADPITKQGTHAVYTCNWNLCAWVSTFVVLFNIIHVVRVVRLKMHVTHCTSLHHMSDVLFYKQESRFKSLSYLLLFHFLSSS